jgi:hypothetical protein
MTVAGVLQDVWIMASDFIRGCPFWSNNGSYAFRSSALAYGLDSLGCSDERFSDGRSLRVRGTGCRRCDVEVEGSARCWPCALRLRRYLALLRPAVMCTAPRPPSIHKPRIFLPAFIVCLIPGHSYRAQYCSFGPWSTQAERYLNGSCRSQAFPVLTTGISSSHPLAAEGLP